MKSTPWDEMLTVAQAAEAAGVTPAVIRGHIRRYSLPAAEKFAPHRIRVDPVDLRKWQEEQARVIPRDALVRGRELARTQAKIEQEIEDLTISTLHGGVDYGRWREETGICFRVSRQFLRQYLARCEDELTACARLAVSAGWTEGEREKLGASVSRIESLLELVVERLGMGES